MYITFDQYKQMGGKRKRLAEDDFPDVEFDARNLLDHYTHRRILGFASEEIPESVRRCMVKLIDMMQALPIPGSANARQITSESNDGVSRSFATQSPEEVESALLAVITRYLSGEKAKDGVPLLFAGRYPR